MICRVCGKEKISFEKSEVIVATDRMTGKKDSFSYAKCEDCGTLQATGINISEDMGKYYPEDYYSYDSEIQQKHIKLAASIIKKHGLTEKSSVLDFGAGGLALIKALFRAGVGEDGQEHKLRAFDPYAPINHEENGLKLQKDFPKDITFDFVFCNHVLEHSFKPEETLDFICQALKPGGTVEISVPNPNSFAFNHFKENWVQLDAPRHLTLFPPQTLVKMANNKGLEIYGEIEYNSTGFGIIYSMAYEKGVLYKNVPKWIEKNEFSDQFNYMVTMTAMFFNHIKYGDQYSITFRRIK